jgi:hypothetical protein
LHHEAKFQNVLNDDLGRIRFQATKHSHPAVVFR